MLTNLLDTGLGSRGIKKRTDLSNMNCAYKQGAAYSLLEVCFIDSPNDMNIYKLNKSAICSAIANGIVSAYKDKAKTINNVTELFNVNDIVWELEHRGIITEKKKWLDKLQNDMDSYWLARKALQFIRSKNL